jgi:hypothetical protein
LTISEYHAAQDLARKIANGMQSEGVRLWTDFPLPSWRVIEIPWPDRADRKILIGLPLTDGPWAATNAFFLVAAPAPGEKNKPATVIVDLAKVARRHIEDLVEGLGWPANDTALHRAIDRCLELEEKRTDASR